MALETALSIVSSKYIYFYFGLDYFDVVIDFKNQRSNKHQGEDALTHAEAMTIRVNLACIID
jgi:hypothetical protein